MEKHHLIIPVWFFVGLLLGIYGILIFASGLAELSHLPNTVMANLRAPIWWGAVLIIVGACYTISFWPTRGELHGK